MLRAGDLPGWKAVRATPGIGELAPGLSGLTVTGEVDAPTLVHAGDAVRATALLFETSADAAEALRRAAAPPYVAFLRYAFRTEPHPVPEGGYRLDVPRQSDAGNDMVELYVLRRGRAVALVELISGPGFDRPTRNRLLALVRSRL